MSSKITSFARFQSHGISNPLTGGTIPVSNDHTDGSWSITDIYDRESIINTSDGGNQYRAGSEIYGVRGVIYKNLPPITEPYPQYPKVIESVVPIYNWVMNAASGSINSYTLQLPNVYFSSITSVEAFIYTDSLTFAYPFIFANSEQIGASQVFTTGGSISFKPNVGNPLDTDITLNVFGDSVDGNTSVSGIFNGPAFNAPNTHRGWITIKHFI